MFDVGFAELILLAIIGVIVIGPERMPAVARTVGKTIGNARRILMGLQRQIEQEIKIEELNKKVMADSEGSESPVENQQSQTIHQPQAVDAKNTEQATSEKQEETDERNQS